MHSSFLVSLSLCMFIAPHLHAVSAMSTNEKAFVCCVRPCIGMNSCLPGKPLL
jgi:hypothetical protein